MAASTVARICDKKSCVRARISRNVHITVLNQKITKKVTAQPIIAPIYPDIAPSEPDEDDAPAALDVGDTAIASKAGGKTGKGIPITGQTPLSEERF